MAQVTVHNAKTLFVTTHDGINLAYRVLGPSTGVPLLSPMHLRGTIDHWDLSQTLLNARLLIYPDSGQGFLFQFSEQFAQEANEFLDGW
ncbi:hypothetical protein BGZ57DRAFT_979260 [Hyaloscypha finlandica]|nr:hypothetical protein F5882DRAFT_462402 [Hyaloscypha sp. PMI_1271]KAH8794933.1 hypothetical protein BGZ57DRAFT_979260 [Hyaloscypha finlandica]